MIRKAHAVSNVVLSDVAYVMLTSVTHVLMTDTEAWVCTRAPDVRTASHTGTTTRCADPAVMSNPSLVMEVIGLHTADTWASMIAEACATLVMMGAK